MRADRTCILRLSGGDRSAVHAAEIAPGWNGRAFCGVQPRHSQLWDLATGSAVNCWRCAEALRGLAAQQEAAAGARRLR